MKLIKRTRLTRITTNLRKNGWADFNKGCERGRHWIQLRRGDRKVIFTASYMTASGLLIPPSKREFFATL